MHCRLSAIRNIRGEITNTDRFGNAAGDWDTQGVFYVTARNQGAKRGANYTGSATSTNLYFNANLSEDAADYNPIAGHANGDDIHPYNIAVLPLISY